MAWRSAPTASSLASACADGLVKLWDVATGKELRTFQGHSSRVLTVVFSPDGNRLISGGDDYSIRIWDVAGEKEPEVWWWHKSNVLSVACCRDPQTGRQYVGAASDDGTWTLWELPPWASSVTGDDASVGDEPGSRPRIVPMQERLLRQSRFCVDMHHIQMQRPSGIGS